MQRIIDSIRRIYNIEPDILEELISRLQPVALPRKSLLVEPRKRNDNVYFIEQGIARAFNVIDGKEITSWFSKEGDLIYSTNSFYGSTPGYETETVQVLENSLFYYLSIAELDEMCRNYCGIANWLRVLHQRAFVEMEWRLISRFHMTAEQRYLSFSAQHPDLFQRVNLGYIASYLGMSQVTLCSLRK